MRKSLTILSVLFLLTLASFRAEKVFTLKYNRGEVDAMWRQLSEVQLYLDDTGLPHNEVKLLTSKLDSAKRLLYRELRPQMADTTTPAKGRPRP